MDAVEPRQVLRPARRPGGAGARGRPGWTCSMIPVAECEAVVDEVDVRGIARRVHGLWRDDANPLAADTAQRQAGVDALSDSVDWMLQVDNDEILPDPAELARI